MLQDFDHEDSSGSSDCSFLSDEYISTLAVLKGASPVLKLCNRCICLQLDDKALGGTVNEHLHRKSLHYGTPYLSCWGTRDEAQYQLKTEIHSLAARFAGIEFVMLPATIRDAVLVCRRMGIRYLWVDVLCIIQGDKTDWEKESPQMASVYRNAHFAICAAQGTSCVSGFLQRQVPRRVGIPFTSTLDTSISGSLLFGIGCPYPPSREHESTFPGYPQAAIERRPEESLLAITEGVTWNTRAWTFQEARISKRLLVFGSRMVYLIDEQRQVVVAENGLTSHTTSMYPSYQSIIAGGPGTSMFRTRIWYRMMAEYSRRIITYSMDRLPAISAVAHTFSKLMGGEYLAGFWNDETFCGHLLWYQVVPPVYSCAGKTEREMEKDTEEYVAPSWSWLSVFPRERASEDARGVDWLFQDIFFSKRRESWTPLYLSHRILVDDSDPEGNPYGRIKSGASLTLSAKVYTPVSGVEMRSWADLLDEEMQQLVEEQYRCSHTLWIDGQYLARASLDWMPASASGDVDVLCDSAGRRVAKGVALMAVAYDNPEHQHRGTKFAEKKRRVWTNALHGLVLMPVELPGDSTTEVYQRMGIFSSDALFDGLGGMTMWEDIEASVVVLV